jgi:hypothetical protein
MTKRTTGMIVGAAAGAALMYAFDPRMGNRRLALGRDKLFSFGTATGRFVRGASKDLSNRAYGIYAVTRRLVGARLPHEDTDTDIRRAS